MKAKHPHYEVTLYDENGVERRQVFPNFQDAVAAFNDNKQQIKGKLLPYGIAV